MINWREELLKIVRKTLRDGYLSAELDELVNQIADDIRRRDARK